mmetsp:Transcript_12390/g.31708  ORF Transcript_12390/g.31708 Transcript_12390/m.31708 type:complete len:228 (-) Transcript_12390:336-1019(-)
MYQRFVSPSWATARQTCSVDAVPEGGHQTREFATVIVDDSLPTDVSVGGAGRQVPRRLPMLGGITWRARSSGGKPQRATRASRAIPYRRRYPRIHSETASSVRVKLLACQGKWISVGEAESCFLETAARQAVVQGRATEVVQDPRLAIQLEVQAPTKPTWSAIVDVAPRRDALRPARTAAAKKASGSQPQPPIDSGGRRGPLEVAQHPHSRHATLAHGTPATSVAGP